MKRLLDVTLFLSKQNLAFRGHFENENSSNRGNFLEIIHLIAKYDPVLSNHLSEMKRSNEQKAHKKHSVSYLSPSTQNEFISVLAEEVRGHLVKEIIEAKYYGIMFDSTPDISHVDQMCEIIRYVHIDKTNVEIEVFLGYFVLTGKTALQISSSIL